VLLQATLPGAPCIYYGDEVGLPGGIDPDSRRGFPPEAAWDRDLLAFVAGAMRLRRSDVALRRGSFRVLAAEGSAMAFERALGSDRLVVALNAGASSARLDVSAADTRGLVPVVLPGWPDARIEPSEGGAAVELPGRSGSVHRWLT
jgi:glycosidase